MKYLVKNINASFLLLTSLLFCQVAYAGYQLSVRPGLPSTLSIKDVLRGITHDLSPTSFMFTPNYEIVGQVRATVEDFGDGDISMYSATPDFARQHGGVVINEIIDNIPASFYEVADKLNLYPIIDIRVHDLDLDHIPAGYEIYLAVPGWHADGGFREDYFAKTDLSKAPVSLHAVATVSTHPQGVSNTRFLDTAMQVETVADLPEGSLWADVHRYIETLDNYSSTDMPDGGIVMFDARSLHKTMPVKRNGKRLFLRMSLFHRPGLGDGQFSKQEQLYLLPKPGFKEEVLDPIQVRPPDQRVIGTFAGHAGIPQLAQEQSIFGATIDEIERTGGDTAKRLVAQIPADFAPEGYVPVVDMFIFRLNPGDRPFFPNYEGKPQSFNWHLPTVPLAIDSLAIDHSKVDAWLALEIDDMIRQNGINSLKELWMSVSSHEDGVNITEFSGGAQLQDGEVLLTSAAAPRRELRTENRGWRLMLRVRLVAESKLKPSQTMNQQYVGPSSEEEGW